ncbi:MAG TPA: glycosyltransferase family 1 protein [Acidiferrobacteraceae bacterium]|nr:glycosyltransferase family 1 protein [Acidiferrobacteraceae bacterium]
MSEPEEKPICAVNFLYVRPGYIGGTVRYVLELLAEFAESNDFDWHIFAQKGAFPKDDPRFSRLKIHETGKFRNLLCRVIYEQLFLPSIARKYHVDLLFSPGFVAPLWGGYIRVVTIHDLYFKKYPAFVRRWQRIYWSIMVPLSLHRSTAIITVSDTTSRDLCLYYPWISRKVERIYLGSVYGKAVASRQLLPFEAKAKEQFCLVVGNLTPNKNIKVIVEAMAMLNEAGPGCGLKVVGSDLFGELSDYLSEAERFTFPIEMLSDVDDECLSVLYRGAVCTIQASTYEGFGLPVIEAMAHGCPVIISDADVLMEIAGDTALHFKHDRPDDLAGHIRQLIDAPELRDSLIAKGYLNAKRFSWSRAAGKTTVLFKRLLDSDRL